MSHADGSGFNVILEVIFEDQVRWLARIPRPEICFLPVQTTLSYAATLKYLRTHTTIPVPQVYGYAAQSDTDNPTGVSYVLMEKLKGEPLPEIPCEESEPTPCDLVNAKKVHQQLADIQLQLGKAITQAREK